jgi:hypothetical protein
MAPILGIYASQISGHLFAPSGAYDSIATVNASGQSSITFSSIPQTYTHLQLRCFLNNTGGNISTGLTFNGSGGSNYARHVLYGDGTSALTAAVTSVGSSTFTQYSGSTSNIFHASIIDILDYTNTNKNKTVRSLNGADYNGSGSILFGSAVWMVTDAISSLTVVTAGSTWSANSSFALYGIKGA